MCDDEMMSDNLVRRIPHLLSLADDIRWKPRFGEANRHKPEFYKLKTIGRWRSESQGHLGSGNFCRLTPILDDRRIDRSLYS
jgi:hypothetical protein